jgi:hypothetical protein
MKRDHGPAWVIIERNIKSRSEQVLSLLPSRKSVTDIKAHAEQVYVDKYYSIEDRIKFKKSRKSLIFPVFHDHFSNIIHIGTNPTIIAIPARNICLNEGVLTFRYRIATDKSDRFNPTFEDRSQSITVETDS